MRWKTFPLFSLLTVLALCAKARSDPIELNLSARYQQGQLLFFATMTNNHSAPIAIIRATEASEFGLCMPLSRWYVDGKCAKANNDRICGNSIPLPQPDDIVVLRPGQSAEVMRSSRGPLLKPGTFQVTLVYVNNPRGRMGPFIDSVPKPQVQAAMRSTTPIQVASNTIHVTIRRGASGDLLASKEGEHHDRAPFYFSPPSTTGLGESLSPKASLPSIVIARPSLPTNGVAGNARGVRIVGR